MDLFFIYLWLKLDAIGIFCASIGALLSLVVVLVGTVNSTTKVNPAYDAWKKENSKQLVYHNPYDPNLRVMLWSTWPRWKYVPMMMLVMSVILPTSRDTAIIFASHYALELSKSPEGEKVWQLVRGTVNKELDAALADLVKPKGPGKP